MRGNLIHHKINIFVTNKAIMKGVSFVTNDKNEKIAVQIDLKTLDSHHDAIEDILDVIVAERRKNDENVSWEIAKKELKKAGKL